MRVYQLLFVLGANPFQFSVAAEKREKINEVVTQYTCYKSMWVDQTCVEILQTKGVKSLCLWEPKRKLVAFLEESVGSGQGHTKYVTTTADATRADNGENLKKWLLRPFTAFAKPKIPQSGSRDTCC